MRQFNHKFWQLLLYEFFVTIIIIIITISDFI